MILDSSVILAVAFKERHGQWAKVHMQEHRADLVMSTVNLAEVLMKLREKQPQFFDELRQAVIDLPIQYISPDFDQAHVAAQARNTYKSLNFGDCFAYVLAKELGQPILTLDPDFKGTDIEVVMP